MLVAVNEQPIVMTCRCKLSVLFPDRIPGLRRKIEGGGKEGGGKADRVEKGGGVGREGEVALYGI